MHEDSAGQAAWVARSSGARAERARRLRRAGALAGRRLASPASRAAGRIFEIARHSKVLSCHFLAKALERLSQGLRMPRCPSGTAGRKRGASAQRYS